MTIFIQYFTVSPGSDIGLEHDVEEPIPPMQELNDSSREDYGFIHTESHKQFMDLLLEKRKQLENSVSAKQREKREEGRRKEDGKKVRLMYQPYF